VYEGGKAGGRSEGRDGQGNGEGRKISMTRCMKIVREERNTRKFEKVQI
jgi:hypothetical protein